MTILDFTANNYRLIHFFVMRWGGVTGIDATFGTDLFINEIPGSLTHCEETFYGLHHM